MLEETDIPYLTYYAKNINKLLNNDEEYAIGRENEITSAELVLLHNRKSNPIFIGEAGVGKTNLVEGLSQKINMHKVPLALMGYQIYELNLGMMDTDFQGNLGHFNDNMANIINEATTHNDQVILFIDEIHTLIGATKSDKGQGMDASQLLKPPLARGDIHLIGATTFDEFHNYIEPDRAFQRRFTPINVEEPDIETSVKILRRSLPSFVKHYGCQINVSDELLKQMVELSYRYLTDQFLPDKAFDVLDGSVSEKLLDSLDSIPESIDITINDIAMAIYRRTGILTETISANLSPNIKNLFNDLQHRIKGQKDALTQINNAISIAYAGMGDETKPRASFLFLGTAGVGKTETAKALAKNILHDERNMIRLDMGSYTTKDSVERLIGNRFKPGDLTGAVRKNPFSILLLDEIEKSSPAVRDLLLSILDDGELQDGRGRTVNFKNQIVILTSNLGASLIKKRSEWMREDLSGENKKHHIALFETEVDTILRKHFRPELVDRFDNRVIFDVLGTFDMIKITQKYLDELERRMLNRKKPIHLIYNSDVVEFLVDLTIRGGGDKAHGARPLMRVLQQNIGGRIANNLIQLNDNQDFQMMNTIVVTAPGKKPGLGDRLGNREFKINAIEKLPSNEDEDSKKAIFRDENIQKIVDSNKMALSSANKDLTGEWNQKMGE